MATWWTCTPSGATAWTGMWTSSAWWRTRSLAAVRPPTSRRPMRSFRWTVRQYAAVRPSARRSSCGWCRVPDRGACHSAPMRVVVVGGSIAGLTAGLALTRFGHDVTIVERDGRATAPTAELAASASPRGGVPQSRQPHGFICRVRAELLTAAPDVWRDLLEAGAVEHDLFTHRPPAMAAEPRARGDDDLVFLLCRRTTFEWVLRRTVERACDLRLGTRAEGLLLERGRADSRVVGLATSGGLLAADLVVDASGRGGGLRRRLTAAGLEEPPVDDEPCGIEYTGRFYRLQPGAAPGPLNRIWAAGGAFAGYSCVLFPHDANTLSVGCGRLPHDFSLAVVHNVDGFDRAVAAVPFVSEWLRPEQVEALPPPVPMAGIHNMLSPMPSTAGLVAIGDAVCTTDPAFGRGAAIAMDSGFALARAVDRSGDVETAAERFRLWFADNVVPWHGDSVAQDRGRKARWQAAVDGEVPAAPGLPALTVAAAVAGVEPVIWRAFVPYAGMLAPPASLFSEDTTDRMTRLLATGWTPTIAQAPSHGEMAELVSARK